MARGFQPVQVTQDMLDDGNRLLSSLPEPSKSNETPRGFRYPPLTWGGTNGDNILGRVHAGGFYSKFRPFKTTDSYILYEWMPK